MGGDETFEGTAPVLLRGDTSAGQHGLERLQQLLGDDQILGVTGVVKGDEDLVGEPAAVTGGACARAIADVAAFIHVRVCKLTHNSPAVWPGDPDAPLGSYLWTKLP